MRPRTDLDSDALVLARKIMAGLSADACRGCVFPDDGREWERICWLVLPPFRADSAGPRASGRWRAIARAFQRRLPQRQTQAIHIHPSHSLVCRKS